MADSSTTPKAGKDDERLIAALAYLIFFLPMILKRDSEFAMFHAKQGLVLLLTSIIGSFILGFIPIIGWIILPFFSLAVFVLGIMGFINALNGKKVELPLIGSFASNFKF